MKKLWFARHAKSSWEYAEYHDFERPLLAQGIDRTQHVIKHLSHYPDRPDLIISSPAVRTHETAKQMAEGLGYPIQDIRLEKDLYLGHEDHFWSIIFEIPDTIECALLVGHNPTITKMVNYFMAEKIVSMPTSALAAFSFQTSKWELIPNAKRNTEHLLFPKMLGDIKD